MIRFLCGVPLVDFLQGGENLHLKMNHAPLFTTVKKQGKNHFTKVLCVPTVFFLCVIYYCEIFLKLYCFHTLSLTGVIFTFLCTIPAALVFGLVCGGTKARWGRILLPIFTALICLWLGAQTVYYHLFKTFLSIFSLTKMMMVAKSFGSMAASELVLNWFPIFMMVIPFALSVFWRNKIVSATPAPKGARRRFFALIVLVHLLVVGVILQCGGGALSLSYIYLQAAAPTLETQNFGMLTQTQLEIRRLISGIPPDSTKLLDSSAGEQAPLGAQQGGADDGTHLSHMLPIDFEALLAQETDENLINAHRWFSQREPTQENEWTGYFSGKNLIWIVAESFSPIALDPLRTPALWKLSHEGFVFDNFYTPLWGVSTSDGEYVTTTGLIPKSGVWSYPRSADKAMPFAFGTQLQKQGYRTMAFHDYLFDYYDRQLSHPNMGYEYYGIGQGLELESAQAFPPSDAEMMEKIVPMFVNEDKFHVYCLTVSGHLNYTLEENSMSAQHWGEVSYLPYSDDIKCYLASQMELELAMQSLLAQLHQAGKLEDTVIVLSADHYPYALDEAAYSDLLGGSLDPNLDLYKNNLIIWNSEMNEPVQVDKFCSSLDIMPTLSNLFGLTYDSRLIMGTDILSSQSCLVVFSDYSFINEQGYYLSATDEFSRFDGAPQDTQALSGMIAEVQNRVAFSALILDYDYYDIADIKKVLSALD